MNNLNINKEFYNQIKKDLHIFNNSNNILKKLSEENILYNIKNLYENIIKDEIIFVINQIKKIKKNSIDEIKYHCINNSYIFKENFKIINNFIIDNIWKNYTQSKFLDDLLNDKKYIFDIKEESNDDISSERIANNQNINLKNDEDLMKKINLSLKLNNLNCSKNIKRLHIKKDKKIIKNLKENKNVSNNIKKKKKNLKELKNKTKLKNYNFKQINSQSFNLFVNNNISNNNNKKIK